jgi:hypothetical protein
VDWTARPERHSFENTVKPLPHDAHALYRNPDTLMVPADRNEPEQKSSVTKGATIMQRRDI